MAAARFGKYILHERIGAGGMAEVYRATLPGAGGIDKPCVLKRILPLYANEPAVVQMFLEEARISISLQHGNIVPILDFGQAEGTFYLAMEHVAGKDLRAIRHRLREAGQSFPVGLCILVAIEVCKGLSYAHGKLGSDGRPLGLVHRDVSPSNILISYEGEVRLLDFGIARVRDRKVQTLSPALKGKVPYMSPEQASGEPLDGRTDIYSCGVVLYEMLTGRRPFEGKDQGETLERVRAGQFVPARELRPEVAPELDEIVRRAMAKAPAHRFQEARAMQVMLARLLGRLDSTITSTELSMFVRSLFADETAKLISQPLSLPSLPTLPQPPEVSPQGVGSNPGPSSSGKPLSQVALGSEPGAVATEPLESAYSLKATMRDRGSGPSPLKPTLLGRPFSVRPELSCALPSGMATDAPTLQPSANTDVERPWPDRYFLIGIVVVLVLIVATLLAVLRPTHERPPARLQTSGAPVPEIQQ